MLVKMAIFQMFLDRCKMLVVLCLVIIEFNQCASVTNSTLENMEFRAIDAIQTDPNNVTIQSILSTRSKEDEELVYLNSSWPEDIVQEPPRPFMIQQLQHLRDSVRFWVQQVAVPCVTTLGLLGNALTVVIMCQRRMRTSSTHIYLAALAIFDALYLICSFLLSFVHYSAIKVELNQLKLAYWYGYPTMIFACDVASNTSIWLTVCFTIER